jgi:lipoprotein-anchoring transpeptidase ErfK/SrfK
LIPSKTFLASQALDQALSQAYTALQRGDKREARHLAQIAASMKPNSEEPWLILAAASQPRASVAYLKRALEINPQSERARGGLEWATRRLNESMQAPGRNEAASSAKAEPLASSKPVVQKRKPVIRAARKPSPATRVFIPIMVLTLALLLIAAWTIRPGKGAQGGETDINLAPSQVSSVPSGGLTDPTLQTSTSLPTETNPPSVSPSPTAFQPVAATATSIPTITPLPANTPQPSNGLLQGEFFTTQIPPGGEKLITVSLQEQRLYAYQDGTLVGNFVVSTGRSQNTRTGTFHILDKIPRPFSVIWNFWMPDWMGIYYAGSLENGFHSLPVLPNGETIWGDALGTPVSYGCVVLGEQEAQALYDWAEVGTTVQINP